MLRHGLSCHVESLAQVAERLAIPLMQPIQQPPAARIGQSPENSVIIDRHNT